MSLKGSFRAVNQRGISTNICGIDRRKQRVGEPTQQVDERRRIAITECRDQLPLRSDDLRDHFVDQFHAFLRELNLEAATVVRLGKPRDQMKFLKTIKPAGHTGGAQH